LLCRLLPVHSQLGRENVSLQTLLSESTCGEAEKYPIELSGAPLAAECER